MLAVSLTGRVSLFSIECPPMSNFLLYLRVPRQCQALLTISDCASPPTPAPTAMHISEEPAWKAGLPPNFIPTHVFSQPQLSATTFLLTKTLLESSFPGSGSKIS